LGYQSARQPYHSPDGKAEREGRKKRGILRKEYRQDQGKGGRKMQEEKNKGRTEGRKEKEARQNKSEVAVVFFSVVAAEQYFPFPSSLSSFHPFLPSLIATFLHSPILPFIPHSCHPLSLSLQFNPSLFVLVLLNSKPSPPPPSTLHNFNPVPQFPPLLPPLFRFLLFLLASHILYADVRDINKGSELNNSSSLQLSVDCLK
jgi:hypothetical protein